MSFIIFRNEHSNYRAWCYICRDTFIIYVCQQRLICANGIPRVHLLRQLLCRYIKRLIQPHRVLRLYVARSPRLIKRSDRMQIRWFKARIYTSLSEYIIFYLYHASRQALVSCYCPIFICGELNMHLTGLCGHPLTGPILAVYCVYKT